MTHRSIRPPRLMSPRPTKWTGNSKRSPKIGSNRSTYLPDATLPRSTTSQSGPTASRTAHADRSSGPRYDAFLRSMSPSANPRNDSIVTGVSAARSPVLVVMTRTPPAATGSVGSGGRANRRAYASFPRKYRPLTKLNTSPSGAPAVLCSCRARSKLAFGDSIICARMPPQLAGDRRNTRDGGADGLRRRNVVRRAAAFRAAAGLRAGISAQVTSCPGNKPGRSDERHGGKDDHDRNHRQHERPVPNGRAMLFIGMTFEERHVPLIRFPREVEQVAGERDRADDGIDARVEDHSCHHDFGDMDIPCLPQERDREQRRHKVADPGDEADDRVEANPVRGAGEYERRVHELGDAA